jgi:hypothetical protein
LGGPSPHLNKLEKRCFLAFKREVSWLKESDRALVDIASCLRARMLSGPAAETDVAGQLRMCLNKMGATPVDRSKFQLPPDPEPDELGRFFN